MKISDLRSQISRLGGAGQSLIELLVAIGFAAILIPALLTGMIAARSGRAQDTQRTQALGFAKDAQEVVRSVRNMSWTTFASYPTGQPLHPVLNGSTWTLVPQATTSSGFTRQIVINNVYRDVSGNISPTGTLDPSMKQIVATISWTTPLPSSITTTAYLARLTNLSFLDTKVTDFATGSTNGTTITDIIDGEVELGSGTANDWCSPNASGIVKYTLTGNGQWTAISAVAPNGTTAGHAYTTFGFNQSGNPFDSVNITDPASGNPAVAAGTSFTADAIKTYGLFADPVAKYVYVSSNSNKYQVDVIKTTDFTQHIATFASSGGEAGYSVYVATISAARVGFLTAADTVHSVYKLYSFVAGANPSGALAQNGNPATLAGVGNKVIVVGNYAFVATSSIASPLQVFNVSNPSAMTPVTFTNGFSLGSFQGGSPQGAVDLAVDTSGRYVFLATSFVDANPNHFDVFMIDVSTPSAPVLVGGANTYLYGMNPTGIIPVSGNHMIVVGSGGQEYQVYYTFPAIKYCAGVTLTSGTKITAVAGVTENDGDNFAYILTDDSSGWFQIIPGGVGNGSGGNGGIGTFISQGIPVPNLTANTSFNSFLPIADVPPPTTIAYQVGVAPTCASTFTFIGPNGTTASTDTYATGSAIPLAAALGVTGYQNPGECFKYKVIMNANGSNTLTPILYQVSVNYSP